MLHKAGYWTNIVSDNRTLNALGHPEIEVIYAVSSTRQLLW